jgi:hypothetical protein
MQVRAPIGRGSREGRIDPIVAMRRNQFMALTNPVERLGVALLTLATVFCVSSAPASAGTTPGRIEFQVMREGHPFGRQNVTVFQTAGGLVAETSADLRAALGPLTLFSYTQRCRELWRDGSMSDLRCLTVQNGRRKTVSSETRANALRVTGASGGITDFSAGTLPTSWWTRPPLNVHEMINTETGERLPVRVTRVGRETVETSSGRISADHIRVQGTLTVDLWYDDAGHWVGCAFTASGQHMTYRLLTPPSGAPS